MLGGIALCKNKFVLIRQSEHSHAKTFLPFLHWRLSYFSVHIKNLIFGSAVSWQMHFTTAWKKLIIVASHICLC